MDGRLRIAYFSDNEIETIHSNALNILKTVGFEVHHRFALEMLRDSGADVDFDKKIVRVKPDFVEECLKASVNCFVLGARGSKKSIVLGTNPQFPVFRNGGGIDRIIDMKTGENRPMTLCDVANWYRVLDALDFIDVVSPVYPQDVSEKVRDLVALEALFKNTSKHVNIRVLDNNKGSSKENLDVLITMGEIVAGDTDKLRKNPVFSLFDSPRSPLVFPELTVDVFMKAGEYGIPLFVASMPVAGASGPVTLDGMIQLLHAELLASVVICQTANPGALILLHPLAMSLNWRTMEGLTSSVEVIKITAGIVQVANKIFNMPVDVHGPWSDTSTFGLQSSIESVFQTFSSAFSGAASIAGAGDVKEGKAVSLVQLCIDEEIAGLTMNYLEGIPFYDNFSVEAIERVGIGGNFLEDFPSLEFVNEQLKKNEYYYQPKILNGEPGIETRAKEHIEKLMAEHKPDSLDEKVEKELRKLIESVG